MMKNHDSYKSSGVAWLGDIPEHWTIKKLKYLCEITTGDCDTNMAEPDGEFDLFVRAQNVLKINKYTHECEAVLTAGDGVGVGKVFHYTTSKFSFHQRVYMMSNFKLVIGRYFFYYLSNLFARVALDGGAKSTVDSLRLPTFVNFVFALPSKKEQSAIVQYLDNETARIDDLISEKQNFIKLLEEKRQALISHVVTKGLDDKVPMKDSGVEWIGEVPEHWELGKLKFLVSIKNGQDYKHVETDDENGFPVYGSGGIFRYATDFLYDGESILYGRKGTVDKPLHVKGKFWSVDTMFYSVLKSGTYGRFAYYVSTTIPFNLYQTNTALPSMTQGDLLNNPVAYPSYSEQQSIANYLDEHTAKIKTISDETLNSISLLKERRSALISAAVTGKIDVREEV